MTDARVRGLRAALHRWYGEVARDLPWRRTRDPYALLVSEVMCQQTQVARVVPRYEAWLERWPTAEALAAAPLPDVLAQWSGLGYNRRAMRLREACAVVAREGWPRSAAGLRALPGIGPYTAAAVASFAWDEAAAAVDVNVARSCARMDVAPEELLDPAAPATSNQAAMELGALLCRARDARCGACPMAAAGCASAHAVPPPAPRRSGARPAFQDTNRYVRGRVVAAATTGAPLPPDLDPARVRRAFDELVGEGLLEPGSLTLPVG